MNNKINLFFMSVLTAVFLITCSIDSPDESFVKENINKELMDRTGSCAFGNNSRIVNNIKIVGKIKKDDALVFQAIANITDYGRCSGVGTFDCEITIAFEKFGDGWRKKEFGFDYKKI